MDAAAHPFFPLNLFYGKRDLPLPKMTELPGDQLPEPWQNLLYHEVDMTSSLERFLGTEIRLKVLRHEEAKGALLREVNLIAREDEPPVEYGAIHIALDALPPELAACTRAGKKPFGAVLLEAGMFGQSRPRAFFKVSGDPWLAENLQVATKTVVYGRTNEILHQNGKTVARVVEIVPPLA